jgi:ATP-dependent exoDNAse (exonuclease V) beta subunit
LDQTWNTERLTGYLRHATKRSLTDDLANDLLAIAQKEVSALLESTTWQDLLADATEIYCELPMAALDGDSLVNAVADLVVRRGDGNFRVIDFKTTQTSPEKARELCKANGYLDQVMDYRDILKKCHPEKNITGHIVFVNPVCVVNAD